MAKKVLCFYLSKERMLGNGFLVLSNNRDKQEVKIPFRFSSISNVNHEDWVKNFTPQFKKECNRLVDNNFNYKILFNKETCVGAREGTVYLSVAFSDTEIGLCFDALR